MMQKDKPDWPTRFSWLVLFTNLLFNSPNYAACLLGYNRPLSIWVTAFSLSIAIIQLFILTVQNQMQQVKTND